MKDFEFFLPTKVLFGKDVLKNIPRELSRLGKRCLWVFGKASIHKTGLYDKVKSLLQKAGIEWVELGGIKSNPLLSGVKKGIEIARKNQVEFILATGGGSVIDTAKAISAGYFYDGDVWDFYEKKAYPKKTLPIATVLTIAGTGSELNNISVIVHDEKKIKFSLRAHNLFPRVSFLQPELTFTVGPDYTAYGAFDAFSHVFEVFISREYSKDCITTDFMISLMKNIIKTSQKLVKDLKNYDLRANMMWCSSLALCGLTKTGIGAYKFLIHAIEHTISGAYDIPHGLGLGILTLGWMKQNKENPRLAEFFEKVFDLDVKKRGIEEGIKEFENWLNSLRFTKNFKDLGIPKQDLDKLAENAFYILKVWKAEKDISLEQLKALLYQCYEG
ncbi:MAG: iron-containing alcohol dehydrogenase [Thermodesulfobacteria bacterium]|nr:iron-containing alcohol dehydrogenase [Thermodesulfobacteriota bacterium]